MTYMHSITGQRELDTEFTLCHDRVSISVGPPR